MKYLKINSFIFAFIFLTGSMFMVQCERAERTETADRMDQETYDERESPQTVPPNQGFETTAPPTDQQTQQDRPVQDQDQIINFEEDRQQLITDLTELRNDIEMELNQLEARDDLTDAESERANQHEEDISDIDNAIEDLQNATQDNWNEVRTETEDTLQRIRAGFENATTTTGDDPATTTTGDDDATTTAGG